MNDEELYTVLSKSGQCSGRHDKCPFHGRKAKVTRWRPACARASRKNGKPGSSQRSSFPCLE